MESDVRRVYFKLYLKRILFNDISEEKQGI